MKNFDTISDHELIASALQHNTKAFGELYNRYYRKVYQKCLSLTRNTDEAFDLAEEALLKALNNLQSFRGDSSFSTWLYIITHRHCLESLRKKSRQNFIPLSAAQDGYYLIDSGDAAADRLEMEKVMLVLIDKLPETERKMLLLKYKEGISIETLQRMFQLSASAVKMRLKRTKERLNQLYVIAITVSLAEALAQLS